MSEATIRRATDADAAALAALRRETAAELDSERSDPGFEDRFAAWLARESPRRIIWLAEAAALVGAMNLTVFERMPRPGRAPARWGYLGNAFVLAAYRNRGIGSQLLAALLDHAREQGFVRVVLSPTERAIPFYQRAGFGPADELMVWHPPHGVSHLVTLRGGHGPPRRYEPGLAPAARRDSPVLASAPPGSRGRAGSGPPWSATARSAGTRSPRPPSTGPARPGPPPRIRSSPRTWSRPAPSPRR